MGAGGDLELRAAAAEASNGVVTPLENCAARVRVLGLPFFAGGLKEAVEETLRGGLIVAPAGPTMAGEYVENAAYRAALTIADVVLPDSGAMVLFWNVRALFTARPRLRRLSGLRLLDALLADGEVRRRRTFWVMPSVAESEANVAWLLRNGFPQLGPEDVWIAPQYARSGEIADHALLERLEAQRPDLVFLNIGGGVQEPLGAWLRAHLSYRPAIVCTGAAIAFRSGAQARIPLWGDALYLGWVFRICSAPRRFWPRYWKAWRLGRLIFRHGENAPPMQRG
jgi:exopolysaccharide biosynthesis WecB/TagA/CpsF family protein